MSEQKTVEVRIAVVVGDNGEWSASGWRSSDGNKISDDESIGNALECVEAGITNAFILVATLPIPQVSQVVPIVIEKEMAS